MGLHGFKRAQAKLQEEKLCKTCSDQAGTSQKHLVETGCWTIFWPGPAGSSLRSGSGFRESPGSVSGLSLRSRGAARFINQAARICGFDTLYMLEENRCTKEGKLASGTGEEPVLLVNKKRGPHRSAGAPQAPAKGAATESSPCPIPHSNQGKVNLSKGGDGSPGSLYGATSNTGGPCPVPPPIWTS